MLLSRVLGWQNGIARFALLDNTSTTGGGLIGLTNASTGLIISTIADVEATATAYTSGGSTIDTITTLGTYAAPAANHCAFKQVDSTNHPGLYELQIANARYAVANSGYIIATVQAPGSKCSPQHFLIDLDSQIDARQANGVAWPSSGGIPQVNLAQILGQTSRATKLALEMDGRVTGTVLTTFTPTPTQAEFSDITTTASFSVFISRGFLVTSGAMINMGGVILGDTVGTAGRRLTFSAMPQAFANGDTIEIM